MTVGRFRKILRNQPDVQLVEFFIFPVYSLRPLALLPFIGEFFTSGVRAHCIRS
jgi:hypothetical protein